MHLIFHYFDYSMSLLIIFDGLFIELITQFGDVIKLIFFSFFLISIIV